jgi:hypothetical protein
MVKSNTSTVGKVVVRSDGLPIEKVWGSEKDDKEKAGQRKLILSLLRREGS